MEKLIITMLNEGINEETITNIIKTLIKEKLNHNECHACS